MAHTKINRCVIKSLPAWGISDIQTISSVWPLYSVTHQVWHSNLQKRSKVDDGGASSAWLHVFWEVRFCHPSIITNHSILPWTTGFSLCCNWIHTQSVLQNPDGRNFNQFSICCYLIKLFFFSLYFLTLRCLLVPTNVVSLTLWLEKIIFCSVDFPTIQR